MRMQLMKSPLGKMGYTWMAKCMVPSYARNIFFHTQGGLFRANQKYHVLTQDRIELFAW